MSFLIFNILSHSFEDFLILQNQKRFQVPAPYLSISELMKWWPLGMPYLQKEKFIERALKRIIGSSRVGGKGKGKRKGNSSKLSKNNDKTTSGNLSASQEEINKPTQYIQEDVKAIEEIQSWKDKNPPPYEKLVGDLKGFISRRINIQHRLIYKVNEKEKIIKILRMWSHYE